MLSFRVGHFVTETLLEKPTFCKWLSVGHCFCLRDGSMCPLLLSALGPLRVQSPAGCESIRQSDLPCLEDSMSFLFSIPSGSYTLPVPSSGMVLSLRYRICVMDISVAVWCPVINYFSFLYKHYMECLNLNN